MSAPGCNDVGVRRLVSIVLVSAATLALVSCGGDDDDSAAPKKTTTTVEVTTTTTEAPSTVDVARYCEMEGAFNDLTVNVDTTDPKQLQALVNGDEYQALVAELFRVVPAELADDVHLLNGPVQTFAADGDYDAYIAATGEPDQLAASHRLQNFQQAAC